MYRTLMKMNVVGSTDVADIWCCLSSPQFGRSSLHFASCKGHVEMVELLIDRGADVKVKDKVNKAPVSKSLYSSQHVLMMDLLATIMIMIIIVHKNCNVRKNSDRRQIQLWIIIRFRCVIFRGNGLSSGLMYSQGSTGSRFFIRQYFLLYCKLRRRKIIDSGVKRDLGKLAMKVVTNASIPAARNDSNGDDEEQRLGYASFNSIHAKVIGQLAFH